MMLQESSETPPLVNPPLPKGRAITDDDGSHGSRAVGVAMIVSWMGNVMTAMQQFDVTMDIALEWFPTEAEIAEYQGAVDFNDGRVPAPISNLNHALKLNLHPAAALSSSADPSTWQPTWRPSISFPNAIDLKTFDAVKSRKGFDYSML